MSADCLFCKISAKKIPSKIVYEDPDVFAFDDISPQAPTHILICPRKHFESLREPGHPWQTATGRRAVGPRAQSSCRLPHGLK